MPPPSAPRPAGMPAPEASPPSSKRTSGYGAATHARGSDPDAPEPELLDYAPSPGRESWGVLQYRHYRNVLGAQFISNIGTWSEFFAIQMFIAQATGRLDDQSNLGLAQQVPIFLLGLFGGLLTDRVNRRTLLIVTQLMAGVVAVGVAIVVGMQFADKRTAIHWLLALSALNGCIMAFNFPAWQVLTPRLVPRVALTKAITLNGIQFNMTRIIGPALAGYVLASLAGGTIILLWANAITFMLMAAVVATTPDAPAPPRSTVAVRGQINEAFSFLLTQSGPRAVLIAQFLLSLLAAPLVRLLSNFMIDVYKLDHTAAEKAGGTMLAVQGIGAVAGGLSLRFIPSWYPKHHFIPLAVAGLGLSICLFATTSTPAWGYAAMLVCGWFWIWGFNQSWAAMQVITPDRLRGRALSLTTVASFGGTALGVVIAGYLGELAKAQGWLTAKQATQGSILILSVPLLVAGIVMMLYRVPEVDGLPRIRGRSRKSRSLVEAVTASEHRPAKPTEPVDSTLPG